MSLRRASPLLLGLWAACATAPSSPTPPPAPSPNAEAVTFSVVATTDVHGDAASMALLGGYIKNLRDAQDGRVLFVDGGDMWQGTLLSNHFHGEPMVKVMNAVGVDAAALGNHEFDWGRSTMIQRLSESAFPVLTANVVRADNGEKPDWPNVRPYALIDVAGVRVGVLGLSTLDTPTFQRAGACDDLRFLPLADTVARWVPNVRKAGADMIVLLAHEGGGCRKHDAPDDLSSCRADSKLFRLVRALPPGAVDLVVGGHTHQAVNHRVAGIPVIQGGAKARLFARADVTWDPGTRKITDVRLHPYTKVRAGDSYAGAPVKALPAAVAALAPYEAKVQALRDSPTGATAATRLTRNHGAPSELGVLITDALRAAVPGAHVGLQNSGGIRADVGAGPITFGELYDVLPFGNKVTVMTLTGAQLLSLLRHGAQAKHGLLQSSGVRLTVDPSKAQCPGESVLVEATLDDGSPIDPGGAYTVVTSDYLALGGSGWSFLTETLPKGAVQVRDDLLLRDAAAAHLKALQAANGPVDSAEHPLLRPDDARLTIRPAQDAAGCAAKP